MVKVERRKSRKTKDDESEKKIREEDEEWQRVKSSKKKIQNDSRLKKEKCAYICSNQSSDFFRISDFFRKIFLNLFMLYIYGICIVCNT